MRLWVGIVLFLCACAPRGEISVVPGARGIGAERVVFVGTTRAIDPQTGRFGENRDAGLHLARYAVSVPPERKAGSLSWPVGQPDPRRDFVVSDELLYAADAEFRGDLRRALAQTGGEAVVFVHGYNTTFAEGLFRIAQLDHDIDIPGTVLHYSWPSAANPFAYAYDRDSALFARDGLEKLLHLAEAAGARRILLVAHSMGAALSMETLRQLAIRGDRETMGRLAGVVLISPDIDVDVFHEQAVRIGTLPQPFLVFTSQRDRALRLSARLTGQADRLGNLGSPEPVADLKVTLLDVGAFSTGAGHFNVGNSPSLIRVLSQLAEVNRAYQGDRAGQTGLLPGAVLTIQNATQIILTPIAEAGL
ncbi:MAG: alpha/beta fold hydrolase [Paracoccaceae bacterium]